MKSNCDLCQNKDEQAMKRYEDEMDEVWRYIENAYAYEQMVLDGKD